MSAEQSVFTFELNETLYFEKGQELEELRGISLDPEITIQNNEDYISIRGVIELTGNYKKATILEESLEEFNHEAKRYIENVADMDEENAEFTHRFPVEISVPTYRVSSLDDVLVSVQAFDYEIPEQTQLKMFSTIAIHGINQEAGFSRVEDNSVEDVHQEELPVQEDVSSIPEKVAEEESVLMERETEDTFEFEIKQKQEEQEEESEIASIAETPTLGENRNEEERVEEPEIVSIAETSALEENREEEEQEEPELVNIAETPTLEKNRDEEEQMEETEETEETEGSENTVEEGRWSFKTQTQTLAEFFNHNKQDSTTESSEGQSEEYEEIVEDESTEIKYEPDSRSEGDITYLSDIFRNSTEEEYTKMRLCIVQKDDTIETISERFKVSPLQIIKQNQLEDDFDVAEGQLLYIPSKK
ncbi:LysM peptidoglycan-binding domain-containing protein [Oceanobacillus sp. Castelsardo]|uniref:LysM peptidoglycan-binding domain-containing protein n=1 Tax=Oceanobacillus sp. Castelsardo TaxID=1851204 RepID=UPI0008399BBB|nr:LysM peptidoglycan-binding domain-containing protein [Oceanobacillus sp. Castelsardo]